jgi:hypothetical protein
MGSGSGRWYQAFERIEMGLLSASTGAQTITASGQYTVGALPFGGSTPRLLRIPRSDGTVYGLEFRQPFGSAFEAWSSSAPVVNGVTIRILPSSYTCCSNPLPRLIDTVPSTSTFTDAPLGAGRTFDDPLNAGHAITIRTDAVGATGATVTVDLHDGGAVPPPPAAPATAEQPATGTTPPTTTPPTDTPPTDSGATVAPPPTVNPPTTTPPKKRAAKKPASTTKKKPSAKAKARLSRERRAALARAKSRARGRR